MKLFSAALWVLSFLSAVFALDAERRADSTTSSSSLTKTLSSASYTTIWVTITTNGALATVQTTYIQSFMTTFTDATLSVAAGSIGMGSLSGDTGDIRTYSHTTVTAGANHVAYSGAFGAMLMLWSLV